MRFLDLPIFQQLEKARSILLAGAGGGYDVFSGLPLYFGLRDIGKEVTLANLSFAQLDYVEESITPNLKRVTADTSGSTTYFPERYLSEWFRLQGEEVPIYCFSRTGVVPIREGYEELIQLHDIDTIILIDGGTDSLMCGDEDDLGTPHEDIASIAAVDDLDVDRKLLICLGFGIDHFHGVCHAHVLESIAALIQSGDCLGTFSLLPQMSEVQRYRQASEYVFSKMPDHISIVTSSILSAIAGHYGNVHATDRTHGSELWINPLMSLYWCFELKGVAQRILYLDAMKQTRTYIDVDDIIEAFQIAWEDKRDYRQIPL